MFIISIIHGIFFTLKLVHIKAAFTKLLCRDFLIFDNKFANINNACWDVLWNIRVLSHF